MMWREYKNTIILDRTTLQKIFTKRIVKWPTGTYIQVITKPNESIEHKYFITDVLGMSQLAYDRLQTNNSPANNHNNIIEVLDDKQMIMKIESIPGSIGYLNYDIYINSKHIIVIDSQFID
jgi:ABC-type phosphate transport system substrate-binding protein